MRNKKAVKIINYLLTAAIIVGGLSLSPLATAEVRADETAKIINLNVYDASTNTYSIAGIDNPTQGTYTATSWAGTTVYYGNKEYYVLDRNGQSKNKDDSVLGHSSKDGHMLLFSIAVLEGGGMNFDSTTSDWSESNLREALNGTFFYNKEGVFTDLEKGAISVTPINSTNTENTYSAGTTPGSISYPINEVNDHVFLLDYDDVYNKNYGFASTGTRATVGAIPDDEYWWLRSPDFFVNFPYVNIVSKWGRINKNVANSGLHWVRPAFNLDLSKVLFSYSTNHTKGDFAQMGTDNGNTWKLTLRGTDTSLDPGTSGITSLQIGYDEYVLPITHTAANTVGLSNVSQVSAMLTDNNETVLYYGKINDDLDATSTDVTIQANLTAGNYKLYVFAEQVNTGNLTDYASDLGTPIEITVENPLAPQQTPSSSDESSSNTKEEDLVWNYEANQHESMCLIEHQGPICVKAFNAATPEGYKEAFSFNLIFKENGFKPSYVRKLGKLVLNISKEWQKSDRKFILIGIDKFGITKTFYDTDLSDETFTTMIDVEGYAFSLIYTDN